MEVAGSVLPCSPEQPTAGYTHQSGPIRYTRTGESDVCTDLRENLMRVIGRNDLVLIVGLAVALIVIFSGWVSHLLDDLRDIEKTRGLHFVPPLLILATTFSLHQLRKRRELREEARAGATAAKEATNRASEMSRLVAFGNALARSIDNDSRDAIRDVTCAHLPLLVPDHEAWVLTRTRGGHWESLMVVGESSTADRERAARRALGEDEHPPSPVPGEICFPMIVAGIPEGVLGVAPEPPLTDHQHSVLSAAAALLAVSLKNAQLFREVRENSVRDGLTGCVNRAHAIEVLDGEIRRARRSKRPLSLIMFDLDHFKEINSLHGHLCGDAVLMAVGSRMKSQLRGTDVKGRLGGDEFLIILPDTPLAGATQVSEHLRHEFESHALAWNGEHVTVTASFGIAAVNAMNENPLAAIARADAALSRAKERGRNGVQAEESTDSSTACVSNR